MRTRLVPVTTAAMAALVLGGCSTADEESGGTAEQETSDIGASLLTDVRSESLTTTETISRGDQGTIIVPGGQFELIELAGLDSVPAHVLDGEGQQATSGEELLRPADGHRLRLMTVSYSPDTGSRAPDLPPPSIELDRGGGSTELDEVSFGGSWTFLVSVPVEADSSLVVTQDGHEQRLDLEDGQRVPDPVADTYYRENRTVDNERSVEIPNIDVETDSETSGDFTTTLTTRAEFSSVELTPWTEENGWALEDQAWLDIDGEFGLDVGGGVVSQAWAETQVAISHDQGDEVYSSNLPQDQNGVDLSRVMAVPVDIESVTFGVSANVEVSVDEPWQLTTELPIEVSGNELEIDLGEASVPAQDDQSASDRGEQAET